MMKPLFITTTDEKGISEQAQVEALVKSLENRPALGKVLLLPPDMTRMHSGAGRLTAMYYQLLKDTCTVDILPALGTHEAMTDGEIDAFFWRGDSEILFSGS